MRSVAGGARITTGGRGGERGYGNLYTWPIHRPTKSVADDPRGGGKNVSRLGIGVPNRFAGQPKVWLAVLTWRDASSPDSSGGNENMEISIPGKFSIHPKVWRG